MSEPTRDQASRWLSRGRWASYLRSANNDHEAALALHRWNARASASLLELLSYLEVMLRHRVDEVMAPFEVLPSARLRADAGWWFGSGTFVEDKTVEAVRRSRDHVAFYLQGAIQPEIAQVVDRRDGVPFSSEEVGRLMATKETGDKRLALVMKHGMANGWDTPTYQVFTLTKPGEQGHVTLEAPIVHQASGRGSAYTQGHRYATVADLERARTTRDLSPWPAREPTFIDLTLDGSAVTAGDSLV